VLHFAHAGYDAEVTQLADSWGLVDFWCHLTLAGRQLALLHVVTAFAFTFGVLCLLPPVWSFLFAAVGVQLTTQEPAWGWIVGASLVLAPAAYLHTSAGWNTWTSIAGPLPTLICGR
jgi:hypothetical protein